MVPMLNYYRNELLESPGDDPLFTCRCGDPLYVGARKEIYLFCISCGNKTYLGINSLLRIEAEYLKVIGESFLDED